MSDDLFNLILWGGAIALLVFSKMRGRNGRFCVETLHFGIAPFALFGALDSGIRGDKRNSDTASSSSRYSNRKRVPYQV